MGSGGMSRVTSDISMKSRSRIFFATFGARDAAGLKGSGVLRDPTYIGYNPPPRASQIMRKQLQLAGPVHCRLL